MSLVDDHFEQMRKALVELYGASGVPTHPTVQGTLREGFVRAVLQGHTGGSVSWSSGQMVSRAPASHLSGQLDLIVHRGTGPQLYLYDMYLKLVPAEVADAVIEVKSDLTTGNMAVGGNRSVLEQALDTTVDAVRVGSGAGLAATTIGAGRRMPTFVVAFKTGQRSALVCQKISLYLANRTLSARDFWPEALLVLRGPASSPDGYAVVRDPPAAMAPHGTAITVGVPAGVTCSLFSGWRALAAVVCKVIDATNPSHSLVPYVFG